MKLTRKQFINASAVLAATAVAGRSEASTDNSMKHSTQQSKLQSIGSTPDRLKRGVSLYSYSGEYGVTMTLEDCFADMNDMQAEGLEILANAHVENYPNPSTAWLDQWFSLLEKYEIVPIEYGHWVDSRLFAGRELNSEESLQMLTTDIKLASQLGFSVLRTKLGVSDEILTPVGNWQEFIEMALPIAEKYNVVMCPELHQPTELKSQIVDEYIEFIERTGTKHFGVNIDFGVFQTADRLNIPGFDNQPSPPEDMVDLLPYTYACHAKFTHMNDDLIDPTHPYEAILKVMQEQNWKGYLLSEYEGKNKDVIGYSSDQLRRQHVMMKRYLGEA